jgi:hypothetical protein
MSEAIKKRRGNDRAADAREDMALRSDIFSTGRRDTGLHTIENIPIFAYAKGPDEDLKCHFKDLEGMTNEEKNEGGKPLYPPDITIQKLWRENRDRYEMLKKEMHRNPKCADLDVFTEGLYTALRGSTQEGYERKTWVSYHDALGGPGDQKRELDKEIFRRFVLPTYAEEACSHLVNVDVSVKSYYNLLLLTCNIVRLLKVLLCQEWLRLNCIA